jgi:hypothetical protein
MTDSEFLKAFEECTIPNTEFNHRAHIRMAWLYLNQEGYESGSRKIVDGIKRFAAFHHSQLYHETITHFWIRLVQHAISEHPKITDFDLLLAQVPCLTRTGSIYQHYSKELLKTARAKQEWCDPDLLSLPVS